MHRLPPPPGPGKHSNPATHSTPTRYRTTTSTHLGRPKPLTKRLTSASKLSNPPSSRPSTIPPIPFSEACTLSACSPDEATCQSRIPSIRNAGQFHPPFERGASNVVRRSRQEAPCAGNSWIAVKSRN